MTTITITAYDPPLTTLTEQQVDADIAALDSHVKATEVHHRAAFQGPVVESYEPGTHVWMWDHYNTATVVCATANGNTLVSTRDADGALAQFSYKPQWLRPAIEPSVFIWPSIA